MKTQALARLRELSAKLPPKPGSEAWFLALDHAKQKDYLHKNPDCGFHEVHSDKHRRKRAAKKGVTTKAKKRTMIGITPKTGLSTASNLYKIGDTYTYYDELMKKNISGRIQLVNGDKALLDIGDGITTEVKLTKVEK